MVLPFSSEPPPPAGRIKTLGLMALVLAFTMGGCARWRPPLVRPHQRVHLADRIMRLDGNRLGQAADQHVRNTREGAIGGGGTAGGGCGCN